MHRLARTAPRPRAAARRRSAGFTLIEMIIVLALVGLIAGSVIVGFGTGRRAELSRSTNQMANTIRFAYNKARVTGDYYRLLINLDQQTLTLQRGDDRMYLPPTDRHGKMKLLDPSKEKEREERDRRAEESYNRSLQSRVFQGTGAAAASKVNENAAAVSGKAQTTASAPVASGAAAGAATGSSSGSSFGSSGDLNPYLGAPKKVPRRKPPLFGGFEDDNSLSSLKEPIKLPPNAKIVSVRTAEDLQPIKKGEASVYFFPQGRTQLAHIQVQDDTGENKYTIIVQPLTGKVEIKEGFIDLVLQDDPRNEKDDLGRRVQRRQF